MKKKVGYFIRSLAHFTYHESTLTSLVQKGHEVHLYADPYWGKKNNDSFDYVNAWIKRYKQNDFKWYEIRKGRLRNLIFSWREYVSFLSYKTRKGQSSFYIDRQYGFFFSLASKKVKLFAAITHRDKFWGKVVNYILSRPLLFSLLRNLEKLIPCDSQVLDYVNKQNLDIIVVSPTDMRFSEEVEIVKASKKLGLKVIIPVLSWDNLTTKGLIHIKPDVLLAWNRSHKSEASSIHKIPDNQVKITGSPFFDKWFGIEELRKEKVQKTSEETVKAEIFEKLGLNPEDRFVLYLGSSRNIAKDETWVIDEVNQTLKSIKDEIGPLKVVIRPHPSNFDHYDKSLKDGVTMFPRPPFSFQKSVPQSEKEILEFYLSIYYSEFIVGINTSAMIETVIIDRPVVSYVHPQYKRTQMKATHFNHLIDSKSIYLAKSKKELAALAKEILGNKLGEESRKLRDNFVCDFVRPYGRGISAGDKQAEFISEAIN